MLKLAAGGDDDELLARGRERRGGHLANGGRDAVDVFERVGEPGAFAILQRPGTAPVICRQTCRSHVRDGAWLWKP